MNTLIMDDSHGENETVKIENDNLKPKEPLSKQVFVVFSIWLSFFLNGVAFGIPTVMIPQIRKAVNSTDAVSPEMASWLYSVFAYSALPWVFIVCFATKHIGRKIPFVFVCLNMFVYFNFLYFSTTLNQVLIAEIMQGVTHASHVSLSSMIITEYASPKYRGLYITIKSANFYWGIWVANIIGTFFHWKYIPLVGIFLSLYFITVLFWPESPHWLATKGNFEKCRREHRWLRGTGFEAEKDLEHLIRSQALCIEMNNSARCCNLTSAWKTICLKAFYKPVLLTILLGMQYVVTGKTMFAMYVIDILKKITASDSTAYLGMLILDGVTIAGMYTGCILSKFLNRRKLLFSASFIGVLFLLVTALYLLLIDMGLLVENKIVLLTLLTLFSISVSSGPLILVMSIASELIPLQYKSSLTAIYGFNYLVLTANLLKLFPFLISTIHMSGTFFMFAGFSMTCSAVLYIYLPETKDKSLQEIEDILTDGKQILEREELLATK